MEKTIWGKQVFAENLKYSSNVQIFICYLASATWKQLHWNQYFLRWSGMIDRKSQGWELFWELNNFQGQNLLTIFSAANLFCCFWSSRHFGQNLIFCGQKHTKNVDNNNEKWMFRPVFCEESENGVQNPLIWKLQLKNVFFGYKLQIKNGMHLQHTIRCTKK